jgi:hypothetical protein
LLLLAQDGGTLSFEVEIFLHESGVSAHKACGFLGVVPSLDLGGRAWLWSLDPTLFDPIVHGGLGIFPFLVYSFRASFLAVFTVSNLAVEWRCHLLVRNNVTETMCIATTCGAFSLVRLATKSSLVY